MQYVFCRIFGSNPDRFLGNIMKFHCYTLGCKVNQYETQAMMALFDARGDKAHLFEVGMPDIGEAVTILGNSDGRGVVTEIRGHILGVGPQQIEVDAPFVAGNSGSPVLNRVGRVVGVASYLRNCRDNADWSKRNTRYNGVRRFALRLSGIRWQTR